MENKRTKLYGTKRKIRPADNSEFDFDDVKDAASTGTPVPASFWSDRYKSSKEQPFKKPLPAHSSCTIKKRKAPLKDNLNKLPKINHLEEICSRASRTKISAKTKLSAKLGNGSFDFDDDESEGSNDKRIKIPSKRPLTAETPAKSQKTVATSKSAFEFPSEAKEKQIQNKTTSIMKPGPKKAKLNMKALKAGKQNGKGFGGVFEMPDDEDGLNNEVMVIEKVNVDPPPTDDEKTMVTNVKDSNNCIRDGESQKFFDEFDYLFDGIKKSEPTAVRVLSVFNIAKSCFSIDFRGNIRKNNLLPFIYKELSDAETDLSLALCTAALMYIISIDDTINDFPLDAIKIMLKILKLEEPNLSRMMSPRKPSKSLLNFKRKLSDLFKKELSTLEVFNLDNLSAAEMVHEILIFVTAPTAQVDFRELIRMEGGIDYFLLRMDYLITSIDKANKYSVSDSKLTPETSEKLNRVERCLQVLENLTYMNGDNQNYLLNFKSKSVVRCLFRTLNICLSMIHSSQSKKIKLLSRSKQTDKVFECLIATMRMMLNLTHGNEYCCREVGKYDGMMKTILENILFLPKLAGEKHKFDCYTLGLGLLINIMGEVPENRRIIAKCSFDDSPWFSYDVEQAVFDQGKKPIELLCSTFLRFHASSNELEKQTFIEAESLCLKEAEEKKEEKEKIEKMFSENSKVVNGEDSKDNDPTDAPESNDVSDRTECNEKQFSDNVLINNNEDDTAGDDTEKEIEKELEEAEKETESRKLKKDEQEEEEDEEIIEKRNQNSASASNKPKKSNSNDPFTFSEAVPRKESKETNVTKKIKVKEVVDNMIAKAGEHMEESIVGSYFALLIGILTKDEENLEVIKKHLPQPKILIDVLKKFLSFMNMMSLTSAAASKSGMQQIRSVVHWLSAVL